MKAAKLCLFAGLGSAALLAGAFAFQHLGGLAPCKMCLWQRWPHGVAVLLALLVQLAPWRPLMLAGAASLSVGAAIGFYHVGVEQGWFEGPDSCTSGPIGDLSVDQLLDQIMATPMVRCDEIAWSFLNLSMAGWNALISGCLALIWLAAAVRAQR